MENLYQVNNLELKFDNNEGSNVVKYEKFEINQGDYLFIQGDIGIGKTAFLEILRAWDLGWKKITNGNIKYKDLDLYKLSQNEVNELRAKTAYVETKNTMLYKETPYDVLVNSALLTNESIYLLELKEKKNNKRTLKTNKKNRALEIHKKAEEYFNEILKEAIGNITFEEFYEGKIPKNENQKDQNINYKNKNGLSAGQTRLLFILQQIIKAKVFHSNVLIMDEPFSNLDSKTIVNVLDLIDKELIEENKDFTVIFTSHHGFDLFKNKINCTLTFSKENNITKVIFERKKK